MNMPWYLFLKNLAIEVYLNQLRDEGTTNHASLNRSLKGVKTFFEKVELRSLYDNGKMEFDPATFFPFTYSDRRTGKKRKSELNRADFLERVKSTILRFSASGDSSRAITQPLIAKALNLGEKDSGPRQLRQKLRDCGEGRNWGEFVDSVISDASRSGNKKARK